QKIEDQRAAYIRDEHDKNGLAQMQDEIELLEDGFRAMIARFEDKSERQRRKQEHRNQWLAERGIDI
ncbi:MAG: hypothetical protein MK116_07385, partial [Phycisphaerales bacterium]|nr:hypothetical protein [Phycisphaerales bacterium]